MFARIKHAARTTYCLRRSLGVLLFLVLSTRPGVAAAPTITGKSPNHGVCNISHIGQQIFIIFDQSILANSGNITVKKYSDDTTVATYDVNSGDISIGGSILQTVSSLTLWTTMALATVKPISIIAST